MHIVIYIALHGALCHQTFSSLQEAKDFIDTLQISDYCIVKGNIVL